MKHQRQGFMMVIAVAMLCLIGVALSSLTSQMAADMKRLHQQTDLAQDRQILIAATESLQRDPAAPVALPAQLSEAGAMVKITPISSQPARLVLRLDAISGKIHLTETLALSRQSSAWALIEVQLQ